VYLSQNGKAGTNALSFLIENEQYQQVQRLFRKDSIIQKMFFWWRLDPDLKPRDLAVLLNVDIKVINQAKKRIKNKRTRLVAQSLA